METIRFHDTWTLEFYCIESIPDNLLDATIDYELNHFRTESSVNTAKLECRLRLHCDGHRTGEIPGRIPGH